jgi:hypothetical protein
VTTESVGNFSDVETGVVGQSVLWGREVGVATDGDGSAIVVDTPARRIVRVARDGSARELWRSTGGWRPTGVAMAASGFYVVEDWAVPAIIADVVGVPRVLFVNPDGSSRTVASASSLLVRGMALLSVLIVLSALNNWRRRLGASRWQAARPHESGLK